MPPRVMPLSPREAGAASALSRFACFGAVKLRRIFDRCGSYEAGFLAGESELRAVGLTGEEARSFMARRDPEIVGRDAHWLEEEGIGTLIPDDPGFPALLRETADPPAFLYFRGRPLGDAAAVAVVGTRRMSRYGEETTTRIAGGLARAGLVVVSGLAIGVDAVAHEAALAAGRTWAFLGSGLNRASVYPPSNRGLAEKIVDGGGALLSEFPPGMAGFKHIFPIRNRLIAGSTLGTVVTEASERSGSLLTAEAAVRYDREVFAVPGDVGREGSAGPHKLLSRGARLVTGAEDVLDGLGFAAARGPTGREPPPEAQALMRSLACEPLETDELRRRTGLPAPELARMLSMLEIGGWARNSSGLWSRTY